MKIKNKIQLIIIVMGKKAIIREHPKKIKKIRTIQTQRN